MKLASSLNLSIDLEIAGEDQWLNLKLEDELNLTEVEVTYPVHCMTLDRVYHLREAMVVGMRRLVIEALSKGLISASPGKLAIWKPPQEYKGPLPSTLTEDDSTLFSTVRESPSLYSLI